MFRCEPSIFVQEHGIYETNTPTKTSTAQYDYSFNNTWDPSITTVTDNATYTAQFDEVLRNYTVSISVNNPDYGSVDKTEVTNVPYGTNLTSLDNTIDINGTTVTATPSSQTAQYTYSFTNWTNGTATVEGNLEVTANFDATTRSYSVSFKDHDGTELKTETVEYGHAATAPTDPSWEGHTFTGWDTAFDNIVEDTVVTAQYSTNKYLP